MRKINSGSQRSRTVGKVYHVYMEVVMELDAAVGFGRRICTSRGSMSLGAADAGGGSATATERESASGRGRVSNEAWRRRVGPCVAHSSGIQRRLAAPSAPWVPA